jgi:hypothetical protein
MGDSITGLEAVIVSWHPRSSVRVIMTVLQPTVKTAYGVFPVTEEMLRTMGPAIRDGKDPITHWR